MKGGANSFRIVLRRISLSDLMPFTTRGERKIRCCKDSTKAVPPSVVQRNYKSLSRIKLSLKGGKMKHLNRFLKLMSSVTIVTLVTTATSCENRHSVEEAAGPLHKGFRLLAVFLKIERCRTPSRHCARHGRSHDAQLPVRHLGGHPLDSLHKYGFLGLRAMLHGWPGNPSPLR